jgi:hypothetical protein
MQGAAGGGAPVECDGRNDNYDSIVSDLASLIEHVEASMKLIESVIAREAFPGSEDIAANVVVLDDVTPCYVRASAALNTCGTSRHGTGGSGESDRRPARSIGRA